MTHLTQRFIEAAEAGGAVGSAVAMFEDGVMHIDCLGKRGQHSRQPVAQDTLFEIGSLTKVFTSLLFIDLCQKGHIDPDDPLSSHLPPSVKPPLFHGEMVRLKHLATHTSGYPNLPTNFRPKNLLDPYRRYSTDKLYQFLNVFHPLRAPGAQFEYSNFGFGLLGHLLSLRQRKSYGSLLADCVLRPLGMQNTGENRWSRKKSIGHLLGKRVPHWQVAETFKGAVGLFSDIRDMAKFLAINLDCHFGSLKQCHKPRYSSGINEKIGLGWVISALNGIEIIWHDGITAGSRAFIGFAPSLQKGIVILANSTQDWLQPFAFSWLSRSHSIISNEKSMLKRHRDPLS